MRVLVLNAGSSTLKASLVVDGSRDATDVLIEWPSGDDDASTAPDVVRQALEALPAEADAVGYRVVHGGSSYSGPTAVDDALIHAVEGLDPLAPLHNRRAAAVIRAGLAVLPDVPHVACFDTAFHAGLPEEAWRYPLPADWVERGAIRRYGFHGLSVAWALRRAAELLEREPDDLRIVVAHLGSGCSITAVDGGRSLDTSMGMTPYEGPMMGTRSGSIDPGILFELMRRGVSPDELAGGLAQRSGLLAVAGVAGMRDVEARAGTGDERAGLAIRMFTRRIAAAVAAAATTLPGLDALVFTGGIGEHSARVRDEVVQRLEALHLPQPLGGVDGDGIAAAGPPAVLVVEAREDLVIAREVAQVVRDARSPDRG
jgi:acetate kinase